MSMLRTPWYFLLVLLASCGARTGLDDTGQQEAACTPPAGASAGSTTELSCGSTCILATTDAKGTALRLVCDSHTCKLFMDEVLTCECLDLDYTSTCSKGVPTCLARGFFSFADVTVATCE
jgi:hypothetical protein